MNERITLAAALWGVVACGLFLCRRKSPAHFVVILLAATGVLGAFHPLLSMVVEPLTWRHAAWAPEEALLGVQREYLSFAIGLLLACGLAWFLGGLDSEREPARSPLSLAENGPAELARRDAGMAWILLALGALLYGAYIARVGLDALGDRDDFGRKYLASQGLGVLSSGLILMMAACLWAEAAPLERRHKRPFRALAFLIALWSLAFMAMRSNVLALTLGYGWIHCRRRGIRIGRVRLRLVAVLALGYLGLETFSVARGIWSQGARAVWETLKLDPRQSLASVVGGSELAHPFLTTLEAVETHAPGELAGRSYLNAFETLLPRFLHPDRPETLSERFVRSNYAQYAEGGGGTGFSLVAEGWLNFGSIQGAMLVGLFLGSFLLALEMRCSMSPHGWLARLAPNFAFLSAIAHRAESASLLKHALSLLVPALVCLLFFDSMARLRDRQQHSSWSTAGSS